MRQTENTPESMRLRVAGDSFAQDLQNLLRGRVVAFLKQRLAIQQHGVSVAGVVRGQSPGIRQSPVDLTGGVVEFREAEEGGLIIGIVLESRLQLLFG